MYIYSKYTSLLGNLFRFCFRFGNNCNEKALMLPVKLALILKTDVGTIYERQSIKLPGNDNLEVGKNTLVMHFPRVRIMLSRNHFAFLLKYYNNLIVRCTYSSMSS